MKWWWIAGCAVQPWKDLLVILHRITPNGMFCCSCHLHFIHLFLFDPCSAAMQSFLTFTCSLSILSFWIFGSRRGWVGGLIVAGGQFGIDKSTYISILYTYIVTFMKLYFMVDDFPPVFFLLLPLGWKSDFFVFLHFPIPDWLSQKTVGISI